jgi:hypothetical protein
MAKGKGEGRRQSSIVPNAPKKGLFYLFLLFQQESITKRKVPNSIE